MPPTVVTFYSFKGGVGRTQTLANMAVGLANRDRKVVAVDMDLESPGLHTYFYAIGAKAPLADGDLADRDGLLEHLERCQRLPPEVPRVDDLLLEVTHPTRRPGAGWIRLLPAGRLVGDYPERVAGFSWDRFYEASHGSQYLDLLRDQLLATGADFVLLDSRTGMTDVASICTFQLPDIVVILFALHQQGLDGAVRVARAIQGTREEVEEAVRPRRVLLVPSRVDEQGELALRDEWLLRARLRLSGLGELLVEQGQHIPYLPKVAYGEQVVIDPVEPNILSEAYKNLLNRLGAENGSASSHSPADRGTFADLLQQALRVAGRMSKLAEAMYSCQPAIMTLSALQHWLQERLQERTALRDEVRALVTHLVALGHEKIDEFADSLAADALDDPRALREMAALMPTTVETVIMAWKAEQWRRVYGRLSAVATDDLEAMDLRDIHIKALEPIIENGLADELEARLEEAEQDIQRSGIEDLLRRSQLELSRLSMGRPDPDDQRRWVEDRLLTLLAQGTVEPDREQLLRNLVRLRIELLKAPGKEDWTKPDVLSVEDPEALRQELERRRSTTTLQQELILLVHQGDLSGAQQALEKLRALQAQEQS